MIHSDQARQLNMVFNYCICYRINIEKFTHYQTLEKCSSYCQPKKIQTLLLALEALEEVLEIGAEEKWIAEAVTSSSPLSRRFFCKFFNFSQPVIISYAAFVEHIVHSDKDLGNENECIHMQPLQIKAWQKPLLDGLR